MLGLPDESPFGVLVCPLLNLLREGFELSLSRKLRFAGTTLKEPLGIFS